MFTYLDAVEHVLDYGGQNPGASYRRHAVRAIQSSYRIVANAHRWSYYYDESRIITNAPFTTGTIEYEHSGGTFERQVILTGGTWPDFARNAVILIDNVHYEISERKSSTVLTLTFRQNPGADIAAGTTFILYQDTYPMPTDFVSAGDLFDVNQTTWPQYVHPETWLRQKRNSSAPSEPYLYTFRGDPNHFGVMVVSFHYPPDDQYEFDFVYQRRPRPIKRVEEKAGTVTVALNSSTVTGANTNFVASMLGSAIRFSELTNQNPTGIDGTNPFLFERTIVEVVSSTSVIIDDPNTEQGLTATKYVISDVVDIEDGAMLECLLRCFERELATNRRKEAIALSQQLYEQALIVAREADSRSFAQRYTRPGPRTSYFSWITDRQLGADVE